jgi:hypothetical protein
MPESSQAQPIGLFDIIAGVESNNRPDAIRFEPDYYERRMTGNADTFAENILANIIQANRCSRGTAKMIYCTSFGATQIMGCNLYSAPLRLTVSVGCLLNDPMTQRLLFYTFVADRGINFTLPIMAANPAAREAFARKYNGSLNYLGPLCDALRKAGLVLTT